MKAYVVGGFVRDLVMRNHNLDVDIVVEGDGIAFADEFSQEYPCRVRPHHKFGTAVLVFPDDYKIRITSYNVCYTKLLRSMPAGCASAATCCETSDETVLVSANTLPQNVERLDERHPRLEQGRQLLVEDQKLLPPHALPSAPAQRKSRKSRPAPE